VFDEHCKGRSRGTLDDLFGVERDLSEGVLDGEHIAEVNGELYNRPLAERLNHAGALRWQGFVAYERGLRAAGGEAFGQAGDAAVLVGRDVGDGRAMYLNISVIPYLLVRYGAEGAPYRQGVTQYLEQAGIGPRVRVFEGDTELPNVERLFWWKDGHAYLCLIWNALSRSRIDGVDVDRSVIDGPARTITIRFAAEIDGFRNLRTGKDLGSGADFEDTWLPCEANVYEVEVG
jgi:hypothetical protein